MAGLLFCWSKISRDSKFSARELTYNPGRALRPVAAPPHLINVDLASKRREVVTALHQEDGFFRSLHPKRVDAMRGLVAGTVLGTR